MKRVEPVLLRCGMVGCFGDSNTMEPYLWTILNLIYTMVYTELYIMVDTG